MTTPNTLAARIAKSCYRAICDRLGIAYTLAIIESDNTTIILKSDLWVTVTDGSSKDMLPLNLCSQELVDEFTKKLEASAQN